MASKALAFTTPCPWLHGLMRLSVLPRGAAMSDVMSGGRDGADDLAGLFIPTVIMTVVTNFSAAIRRFMPSLSDRHADRLTDRHPIMKVLMVS